MERKGRKSHPLLRERGDRRWQSLNSIVSSGIESMSECEGRLRVKMSESVIPGVAACLGLPQRGSGTEIAVTRAMGTPGLKPSG